MCVLSAVPFVWQKCVLARVKAPSAASNNRAQSSHHWFSLSQPMGLRLWSCCWKTYFPAVTYMQHLSQSLSPPSSYKEALKLKISTVLIVTLGKCALMQMSQKKGTEGLPSWNIDTTQKSSFQTAPAILSFWMVTDVDRTAKKEQLQCCSKMHTTWPKSSWAIFLRCQQTNVQTQVLGSFSALAVDTFLSPCQTKLPQGSSDTLMAGPWQAKPGLGALLSSCPPSEPAASDGTTAWESHRENCFSLCKTHQVSLPLEGMGLSLQAMSNLWCGEKILLLRRKS